MCPNAILLGVTSLETGHVDKHNFVLKSSGVPYVVRQAILDLTP